MSFSTKLKKNHSCIVKVYVLYICIYDYQLFTGNLFEWLSIRFFCTAMNYRFIYLQNILFAICYFLFCRRIFCTGFPVRGNKSIINLFFFFLFAVAVIENCYTFAI